MLPRQQGCKDKDRQCDVEKMIADNKRDNKKYFDDEQVKSIWNLVEMVSTEDTKNEMYEKLQEDDSFDSLMFENGETELGYTDDCDQDYSKEESDNEIGNGFENLEWEHMYPIRKSLYNRKTHFISFIQNYAGYHMGRKLMSEYESTMCDFILSNMKPTSADEFLKMLKECKLSNVYRYHVHVFNSKNRAVQSKRFEISPMHVDKIVHIFNMFQAFFHRQMKFSRKNFLSMRFLLGRILIFLKFFSDVSFLPPDLKRPKGKTQLLFHEQIWQQFLISL